MEKMANFDGSTESKSESRNILRKYYSVQFAVNNNGPAYLFKLRDICSNGMGILVKDDSSILGQLEVGNILKMEYNQPESLNSSRPLKTQITSKYPHYQIAGHTLVELSIVENI